MTTSRISAVAIALSIAFGFVGGARSTQGSAKDQSLSGPIASSKRMADGKEWTTANLNVITSSSYCYDDAEPNCRRYGRLYTWESAQRGCQSLGDGWRLPTDDDWRQIAKHYGGVGNDSPDKGKAAYTALLSGGTSRFNAVLGGNRSIDGQYDRLEAHDHGMSVSGHVAWPLAEVAAGIDGQEHLGPSGWLTERIVYDDVVQLYKAAGMWVVPTLVTASTIEIYKPWLEAMRTSTLKMYRAGILIAAGTDRPSLPGALHEELKQLVESGLTPLEAIRAATFDAARVLRAENEIGSLEEGKIADVLILDANPAENIENTRRIATIIQAGRTVKIVPPETGADARDR